MKIFKKPFKKPHFGSSSGGHDPARSGEIAASSSATVSAAPSCGSDNRVAADASSTELFRPPTPSTAAAERSDYYSSEEEYQVQLALALSASNSDFREDPDGNQIRAATLLSLGRHQTYLADEEESLSRRYWDYNVVDYNEKIVDGFYDIFGLSSDFASQGKIPSLVDLQTNIGDLGFEAIIVNRAIDPALVELEQIAHCISLDSSAAQVSLLVQRISELVTEHMGGPVRDAHDMLTRWMEKSTELRMTLQTSLLPIGCIKIGLSRHRALLFKVLADNVGISCRLVKGSHYTGVDNDAINIIKLDEGREFLVDLMAAPGALIPADVLSAKDVQLASYNSNLAPWTTNNSGDDILKAEKSHDSYENSSGSTSTLENCNILDTNSRYEKRVLGPLAPRLHGGGSSLTKVGSSSSGTTSIFALDQANNSSSSNASSSTNASSSKQKVLEVLVDGDSLVNKKINAEEKLQDNVDSRYLFAELNPLLVGKPSGQLKASDNKNSGFQRRRENIPSGTGRPQLPLVLKNRSPYNEVTNSTSKMVGLIPRKNIGAKNVNGASMSSRPSSVTGKTSSENPKINVDGFSGISFSHVGNSVNETTDTPIGSTDCSAGGSSSQNDSGKDIHIESDNEYVLVTVQSPGKKFKEEHTNGLASSSNMLKEQRREVNDKHDRNKFTYDRFMKPNTISYNSESSMSQLQSVPSRLEPMLDDVAEWEIPWEDLVIGERIGLGSYGEVYRADWNGTEVAVKKFLDQDFYGDALDEFRSEIRIMRRLRHPNIVLFMGAVARPPNLSIVSEFLPRGSLYRILHRPLCQIDEKRRIKMALDVAKGMNCLHTSMPTIVHRDLKSPNLLVDKNWTVKVCDFGLSRLKHNTFLSSKSTAGTPEWMAPEVLRNEPSNEKCDIYSFGVILWELATLRMPWSGMNPMQVVGAVGFQDRRLEIPKEVDPVVARIIWECWQTDPSLRPSFAQLTTALKSMQRLAIPSHQETQNPLLPQEIPVVNSTP